MFNPCCVKRVSHGGARHMDLRMSYFRVSGLTHESSQSFVNNSLSTNLII